MYCLFPIQLQILIIPVVSNRQYIYQKFEDITEVIRIWNWKENREYICRKFEDTTEVIRICNWRENRQHIYQKVEDNHSSN
jgi:uncharacterized protein YqgV (UPF0045/DUF77 family)